MGYYTNYKVTTDEIIPEFDDLLKSFSQYTFFNGESPEKIKWYSHEDDMRKLSHAHPKVLFTVRGEGEESDDLWIKYFLNGKMQKCVGTVVYPPFDAKRLK